MTAADEQYTHRSILRYERMFGAGFVSPGGAGTTRELLLGLGLPRGARVLDVGSGLGGAALMMAASFGLHVVGVDASETMVALARSRAAAAEGGPRVTFVLGDIRAVELDAAAFDLVWSRDTLLHIDGKAGLLRRLRSALRPGGRLLVTDYARGESESEAFRDYVASSRYHLLDLEQYREAAAAAGFAAVTVEDRTADLVSILLRELGHLEANRDAFLAEHDQADFEYLATRWRRKIEYCRTGAMRWALVLATSGGSPGGSGQV